MSDWIIRPEEPADYRPIRELTLAAFAAVFGSGEDEAQLIEDLRALPEHDPELALVAVRDGLVVGHVMLSAATIEGDDGQVWPALCVAPLGVRIGHQRQGIGSALMHAVLARARGRGHRLVVLSGSEKYYPRFGFVDAPALGIRDDLGTPSPHFMVLSLVQGALDGVQGIVRYSDAFDRLREEEG